MPELLDPPAAVLLGRDAVLARLSEVVLGVPGVVRLEPTLSTAGPRFLLHPRPADGLHVLLRARVVDVDVNLATSSTHQARAVAHQAHRDLDRAIEALGYTSGTVSVSVLTIEATRPATPVP